MLKAGIIGIGSMGRGHLNNYIKFMEENKGIELVAICDIDPKKFENYDVDFNLAGSDGEFDFSKFHCYLDVDEMLAKENDLDMVSVITPTYTHCEITCKCLNAGINVFCEKPMAMSPEQCQLMIDTAEKNGKKLMIGQCIRFGNAANYAKEIVDSGKFGKCISAYFYRGGSTPFWSHNDWILKKQCGGGAIFDQHIHDVDLVNYLFGLPKKVSSIGHKRYDESSYDAVSTNYIFEDGKVINTQNDWCEAAGFQSLFRINFENGTLRYEGGKLMVADGTGKKCKLDREFKTEYKEAGIEYNNSYQTEILYLADYINGKNDGKRIKNEEIRDTIKLVLAEVASCDKNGEVVEVK